MPGYYFYNSNNKSYGSSHSEASFLAIQKENFRSLDSSITRFPEDFKKQQGLGNKIVHPKVNIHLPSGTSTPVTLHRDLNYNPRTRNSLFPLYEYHLKGLFNSRLFCKSISNTEKQHKRHHKHFILGEKSKLC